jgi:aromatic-L-amino-acid decarboxylase
MADGERHPMTPEEFRRYGHALVDWVAAYWDRVEEFPVQSPLKPGDVRRSLPEHPPEEPESFGRILEDLDRKILPGITHWQSPRFFGYFPANVSGPSVLGELVSAGLGVQGMLWSTSPACTELETLVLDWLQEAMGLPEAFRSTSSGGGVIQDSASSAALCAVVAARERATAGRSNREGAPGNLTAYASSEAHSSIVKALGVAGVGRENLRLLPVDGSQALKVEALEEAVARDRARGLIPFFVAATVGTTSTHAMDPLSEIGKVAAREGLWFHVDGAMAGSAALCPEFRHLLMGLEGADSYCFNPHKWLFTNFDCDAFYVRDRSALVSALSILPEYLRNRASLSGEVIDYRDWQIPLGRRFRALKLWFVLRSYGLSGLRTHLRRHVALARLFAGWVKESADFELLKEPPLNLVCFRLRGEDRPNELLLERLNAEGKVFLTHTRVGDRYWLRLSVGQTHTQERHVREAWEVLRAGARALGRG